MKTYIWIAGSFFVILFGFIVGIFLAPLLACLIGSSVYIIPSIIAVLSLFVWAAQDIAYNKAKRAIQKSSFYYPGLLVPIFLCSVLLVIHSCIKFGEATYNSHGIIKEGRTYYNSLGVKLLESSGHEFYAYDEYGDVFICFYTNDYDIEANEIYVQYKIYTIDGTLVKSGGDYIERMRDIKKSKERKTVSG